MIKLSDMLIATLDDKDPLIALQINEAKRLEALDVPRNEAERRPLVDDEGDGLYVIWSNGKCIDWSSDRGAAKAFADKQASETGQPHTVCQVMAPESGECPTVPVATFTPTPERPHEWVIYLHRHHLLINRDGQSANFLYLAQRFATDTDAQAYIDSNKLQDAYPWPVPKLTS